eukprot:10935150-Prorocentrum_lima.AAC.1
MDEHAPCLPLHELKSPQRPEHDVLGIPAPHHQIGVEGHQILDMFFFYGDLRHDRSTRPSV